jgi:hypothetical protein
MAEKKSSRGTAKKKTGTRRPAAKKAAKKAFPLSANAPTAVNTPPAVNAAPQAADRLTGVARTIGSRVGGIVAKTKKVLQRDKRP